MEAQNNCTNEQAIGALVVGESRRDLYPDPFSMCPKKRLRPQRLSLLIGTGYRKKRAPGRLAFPREVEEVSSLAITWSSRDAHTRRIRIVNCMSVQFMPRSSQAIEVKPA